MNLTRKQVFGSFKGVRVLVLGADGFIGRWVTRLLT
jgi:nucleoside-diphosphate-sugar epimerase